MKPNMVRVRDVMRTDFGTIDGMATIEDAIRRMKEIDSRCLIVKKREEDDEYGILLLSSIARRVVGPNLAPARINVYEIMAKPLISVHPEMRIHHCAQLFARLNLSRTPVIDRGGEIVGIVSYANLALSALLQDI